MKPTPAVQPGILVVDDDEAQVRLLLRLLQREGYSDVRATTRADQALALAGELRPDLVVLDVHVGVPDGLTLLSGLRSLDEPGDPTPVLMVTGDTSQGTRRCALERGATDFLTRPFDLVEVRHRVRNLLQARALRAGLAAERAELARTAAAAVSELAVAEAEILDRLSEAGRFRDDDTGRHTHRVGEMAAGIAAEMGLAPDVVELLRRAAPLHDVGKVGIPDRLLFKPGPLSPDEFELVKAHTSIGAAILSGGRAEVIRLAAEIALRHHERWDGSGYPGGLRADEIPLAARIVAAADVFDALSHARPYRAAWAPEQVLEHLRTGSGTHFDPAVVAGLLALRARSVPASVEAA